MAWTKRMAERKRVSLTRLPPDWIDKVIDGLWKDLKEW